MEQVRRDGANYFGLVNPAHINPKQRIGNIGVSQPGRVGEANVDDEDGKEGEDEVEAELAEAAEGVPGVDLAVVVAVPEEDVLLEDGLPFGGSRQCHLNVPMLGDRVLAGSERASVEE